MFIPSLGPHIRTVGQVIRTRFQLPISILYWILLLVTLLQGLSALAQDVSYTPVYDNGNFNAQTINVALPVGSTAGSAGVSPSGGSSYTIPITVPPGTNGVAPSIALSYNSQSGDGIAGVGWGLSGLSFITRVPRTMYYDGETNAVEMNNNDRFVLDGMRLILKSGSNGGNGTTYGTESENFSTITSFGSQGNGPEWFQVTTKEGVIMEFGHTSDSRHSGQFATVLTWGISKIRYPDGNYIDFVYRSDVGFNLLIDQINYTGNSNTGQAPYNQVKFYYKTRQDINLAFQADTKIESRYLLDRITTQAEGQAVKSYQLTYGTDPSYDGGQNFGSYLKTLTEAGSDGSSLNATHFKYGDAPANFTRVQTPDLFGYNISPLTGDLNGDGMTDILTPDHEVYQAYPNAPPIFFSTKFTVFVRALDTTEPEDYGIGAVQNLPAGSSLIGKRNVPNAYSFTAYDFTGDGVDDVLMSNINRSDWTVNYLRIYNSVPNQNWQSNGQPKISFTTQDITPYPGFTRVHPSGNFMFPGDFNGDGTQDIVSMLGNPAGTSYYAHIYYSQTTSGFLTLGTSGTLHFPLSEWAGVDNVLVLDFNGDGKSDLMLIKNNECEIITFDQYTARQIYYTSSSAYLNKNGLFYVGDFNGDQKTDLLVKNSTTNQWQVLISTGKVYLETGFTFARTPNTDPYTGDQLAVSDFNGDGKSDVYHAWQVSYGQAEHDVYYSKGYDYHGGTGLRVLRVRQSMTANLGAPPPMVGDANGDGRSDIINYKDIYTPMDIFYFRREGTETLLQKVKNGLNHEQRFTYKKLTDGGSFYTQGSLTGYPLLTMQLPMYLVWEQRAQNGIGGESVIQYGYAGMRLHRAGKGLLGFTKVTASDLTMGIRTESTAEFNPTFFAPALYQTSTYLMATGQRLSQTTLANQWIDLGNRRFWQRVNGSTQNQDLEGRTVTSSLSYDSYGNVTQSVENNNNVVTTTTDTQYGQYGTPVPAHPTQVTTTRSRSGQLSYSITTTYNYNGIGQVTSKTEFAGLPKYITTSYGYNSLGNVSQTTISPAGLASRSSSVGYDGKGRYPTSTTNELGQTATATYDSRWGKPLFETSIAGLTTSYEYDAFGRAKTTNFPEGYSVQQSYGWDFSEGAVYYTYLQHPGRPDVKTWYDGLGREIRKQTEGMNGQWITQKQTYDSRENVVSSTQPYLPGENELTTSSSYDEYNRLANSGNGVYGTTTLNYAYNNGNLTVTTTNPAGQQSSKTTDASGEVITANDNGGSLSYSYYSHGGLKEVKKDGTVIASHEYDAYGRQTKLIDANAGTTSYDYDALGQLVSQTNANAQTHTMQYDMVGRNTSRSGPEGTTVTEYYGSQGSSTNQVRKITGFAGNTTEYTYDDKGRIQTFKQTVDGTVYTTTLSYNTYGDVISRNYSTGFGTNHYYDGNGYLTSIKNSSNTVTLYNTGSLNGLGQVKTFSLGNGKNSQIDYYYGTPTRYYTQDVQDLNLNWNYQTGNLNYRQDSRKGKKENFGYDNLNRLTSFQVEGQSAISMGYASSGNINTKTDAGTYSYLGSKPNAVEYVSNDQGVISGQQQQISYTAFMQPQVLTENGYELTYTYDADYERYKGVLKQNNNVLWTRYYLGDVERHNDKYLHYISSPAGLVAIVVRENGNDSYYYTYTDHLGSILTVSNSSGALVAEQNFDPWGRRRNANDWTYNNVSSAPDWLYRGYTGHEMLDPFVLINMNGRIYDPVLGRVLSPDNIVADPFDTQAFNRYAYAFNNPMVYNDPDGNCPVCIGVAVGIGALVGYLSGKAHGATGWGLVGYTLGGATIAAFSAGIGQAVLGAFSVSASSGMFASAIPAYAASGAAAGLVSGAGFAALSGGNVWQGAWKGAVMGGLTGMLTGLIKYNSFLNALEDPYTMFAQPRPPLNGGTLQEVIVRAPRLVDAASQVRQSFLGVADVLDAMRYVMPPVLASGAVTPVYWETNFIPILPKGITSIPNLGAGSIRGGVASGGLSNAQLVSRSATKAEAAIGGTGRFAGTAKHAYANNLLSRYQRLYGNRGLDVNYYFNNGVGNRGFLDVVDHGSRTIFDYKFGNAVMGSSQYLKYSRNFPGYSIQIIRP
ncbi:RHS repeat-associated core domain-containing protein [Nibrella viscosa]|uniref:RHS repeat-associated core domain-containing protein n=1 Tax=Nibrella viscosa TaxID=1084524 RepID=A0ABP8KYX5_9BACT